MSAYGDPTPAGSGDIDVVPTAEATAVAPATVGRKPAARWRSRLVTNRLAMAGLVLLCLVVVAAVFAPLLAPFDPNKQDLLNRLKGPSNEHWLGTDSFGRDVLSRLIYACRVAVQSALQAVGLALLLGSVLGVFSAFVGGVVDSLLSRVIDAVMAMPGLILALAIVGVLGPSLTNAMVAIGILLAPRFFRVARGATIAVRNETYVEASRAIGCSTWRLLWRHVTPNISSPMLVQITVGVGIAILAEAGLSFLGLGAQPPQASWGNMVSDGFANYNQSETLIIPPVVAIVLTILAISLLGDGLRDAIGREQKRS
jgi:peptide/nickel transport system permease protein